MRRDIRDAFAGDPDLPAVVQRSAVLVAGPDHARAPIVALAATIVPTSGRARVRRGCAREPVSGLALAMGP
jgi:hypothetical protein